MAELEEIIYHDTIFFSIKAEDEMQNRSNISNCALLNFYFAPENLESEIKDVFKIELNWTGVLPAEGSTTFESYKISRKYNQNGFVILTDTITSLSFTDDLFISPDGNYQYSVQAIYGTGESDPVYSDVLTMDRYIDVNIFCNLSDTILNDSVQLVMIGLDTVYNQIFNCLTNPTGLVLLGDVFKTDYTIELSKDGYEAVYDTITVSDESNEFSFTLNSLSQPEIQEYVLNEGYSFVSSRLIPENPNILDILEENLDNLDFVRNTAGLMLRKIGPVWVNSIGDWITTEGYLFKMNSIDDLAIVGEGINAQTPIVLVNGYQMISYLPDQPINTADVFANVLSNLDFVRNTAGLMFRKIGPVWVNSIGNMEQGEGYLVKMNADDILIYPEETKNVQAINNPKPEHFIVENINPYDPVWTIYFEANDMEPGDEIAVYDGDKLVGAGVVSSNNIFENAIPVFSNLYEVEQQPIIKVWIKNENEEFVLKDYEFLNPLQDAWTENIFPEEDGEYSLLHFSTTGISDENKMDQHISIYPNPSEGIFNISIEGVSGKVQIKIFDVHGNYYRLFEFEGTNNVITDKLDLKELAAGIYFISFSGKDFSRVNKIVIQ